ncbi:MAG: hypothetical protein AB7L84_00795 [Acidimicrobiia bacterium]
MAKRAVTALVAAAVLAVSCSSGGSGGDGGGAAPPGGDGTSSPQGVPAPAGLGDGDGFVDEEAFVARQDEYLLHITPHSKKDPLMLLARAERVARDDGYGFRLADIGPDFLAETFARIDGEQDTSDFDLLYLVVLWQRHGEELSAETRAAVEQRLTSFRYWFTEPDPGTPDGKYFWSENHRIMLAAAEALAGQGLPDATFADGRTGAEHRDDGAARALAWIEEKAELGFTEWHSDVYYEKDVSPLLALAELVEDPDLARRSAMALDVLLFDIGLHLVDGNFAASHGRSYMKDKSRAADQGTFNLAKLVFDEAADGYDVHPSPAATLMAVARRYRPPAVVLRAAASTEPFVDRQRTGVAVDAFAPYSPSPVAPPGTSFEHTPDNVAFWWERGAQSLWQAVPLTLAEIEDRGLWENPFFALYKPLVDFAGGDPDTVAQLAAQLAPMLTFTLLSEANSYTYHTGEVGLSTVVDHRPGSAGEQEHAWQATATADAVVFNTHPPNEPHARTTRWADDDGYRTGSATLPRSAQHGATALHLYAPAFAPPGAGPLERFSYLPFTHAWFPIERFDEVVQRDGWTIGRAGDGYVALWSWRPTTWRAHDPSVYVGGLTREHDLVAEGGADNVWISQVGDGARSGTFAEFVEQVTSSAVTVTPRPPAGELPGGFDVRFDSPTEGEMSFGSTGALTVDGTTVDLGGFPRFDNPWAQVDAGASRYEIADDEGGVVLDFAAGTRVSRAD